MATSLGSLESDIAALAVQLEEIELQVSPKKGKHKVDELPDADLALSAFKIEIEASIQLLNDTIMAHSVARAVDADSVLIADCAREELQAEQDRQISMRMNDGHPIVSTQPTNIARGDQMTAEGINVSRLLHDEIPIADLERETVPLSLPKQSFKRKFLNA